MPGNENVSLASMGIYIFEAEYLYQLLEEDIHNQESKHDFGMDVIPRIVGRARRLPTRSPCPAWGQGGAETLLA